MKKLFLATTALVALAAGSAAAADLPVAYKAPMPVRPACASFGGFYLGANVGAGYVTSHRNDDDGYFIDNAGHTTYGTGWNGGVQGGYNWQRGCTLFGVEVDWSWGSAKSTFNDNPNVPGTLATIESNVKSFGTARTRTGIIVDDVMLYVTGGFAWANVSNTYSRNFGVFEQFELSSNRWGWTIGAGSEWKFASNWSLKSEVLYINTKQYNEDIFSPAAAANFRFTNNDSAVVARLGVNYIFGGRAY